MDKVRRYFLIGVIIVLVILIGFVFYRYTLLKTNNLEVEAEKIPKNAKAFEEVQNELKELKKEYNQKAAAV